MSCHLLHIQYTSALSGQPARSCSNLFTASILCSPAAYGASIKALIALLFVCYSFAHVFMSRKNETTFSVQINCVSCHGHTGRFMDWLDIASCRYGWGWRVLISKYSGCTRDREGRRSRRRIRSLYQQCRWPVPVLIPTVVAAEQLSMMSLICYYFYTRAPCEPSINRATNCKSVIAHEARL